MPRTDIEVPSAQSHGHVSDGIYRLGESIYEPLDDKSGKESLKRLLALESLADKLKRRRTGRYVERRAVRKELNRRAERAAKGSQSPVR